jgi:hypothetical protein
MRAHLLWLLVLCAVIGGFGSACFSEADNCLETDSCGAPNGTDAGGGDTGILRDAGAGADASDASHGDAANGDAESGDASRVDSASVDSADEDAAGEDAARADAALDDGGPALDGDGQDSPADGPSTDAS